MLSDEAIKYFSKYVSEENLRKEIPHLFPVAGLFRSVENYELLLAIFLEVRTS